MECVKQYAVYVVLNAELRVGDPAILVRHAIKVVVSWNTLWLASPQQSRNSESLVLPM